MSDFDRFGLSGSEPTWSSAMLEAAIDRALAVSSPEETIRIVFDLLSAPELSTAHANFVGDFVKTLLRRLGPALARCDLGWIASAIRSPAQALLAIYLLPEDRFDPELVLAALTQLERTSLFDQSVVQLQDAVVRPDVARHLFSSRPELAQRVRAVLAH